MKKPKQKLRKPVSIHLDAQDYAALAKIAPDGVTVGRMLKTIAEKLIAGKKYSIYYINHECKDI